MNVQQCTNRLAVTTAGRCRRLLLRRLNSRGSRAQSTRPGCEGIPASALATFHRAETCAGYLILSALNMDRVSKSEPPVDITIQNLRQPNPRQQGNTSHVTVLVRCPVSIAHLCGYFELHSKPETPESV